MKYIDKVERVLKDLDYIARETRDNMSKYTTLDQKIEASRTEKMIARCRHEIRKKYFELEDLGASIDGPR